MYNLNVIHPISIQSPLKKCWAEVNEDV